ncbi:MAG: tetratricopeptide repeat protein [Chitinophagaceae bacterium]|nr:tetratricopeptide repeat protein [Chitinophagaceae bacterium]
MAEKTIVQGTEGAEAVIAKAKDFWTRNGKIISIVCVVVVLGVAGYFVYNNYILKPKQEKGVDALYKAEDYFRKDSFNLALNGDGQYLGFLKVADKFSGTDAGNLACFYAGACYIKLDDNANAIKYLNKFDTDSKPLLARKYKLLGDASGDLGKTSDAVDYYKKAARAFEDDKETSAEALFLAAYMTDRVLKNPKEAIELYKELKKKFPKTREGYEVDNYLAQLGIYNAD